MGNQNSAPVFALDETHTDYIDFIGAWSSSCIWKISCKSKLTNLKNIEGIESNPAWPFKSSETNYEKAEEEYCKSPLELYVATAFGDEIPKMRDDLIERKHHGEGFVQRHFHAWTHLSNWRVDPQYKQKEEADPAHYDEETGKNTNINNQK